MATPEQTPAYALFIVECDESGPKLPPIEELQYTNETGEAQGGWSTKSVAVDGTVVMFIHTSQAKMEVLRNAEDQTYAWWEDLATEAGS